ncbi:helix-turn-helix transcriptional regulator [Streptococcus sp. SN3]|uniref:helix-turn-helix domain-containing protein n=1 Tax=Streptococcus sp. SN3 TaxID=3018246 RepID=UPI00263D5641|nr:helix-turn-helix transcriptional regulator [Streptococcus sp. SN3]MDN5012348.1 helix-turn-helix transcriptional regulator [Streptococcus sp. SN3]
MNRIKELREKKGLSQDKLAKQLAVNLRTLQRWENNETAIRKKNAQQLAEYFGVTVGYLLGYESNRDLRNHLVHGTTDLNPVDFSDFITKENDLLFNENLKKLSEDNFIKFIKYINDCNFYISDKDIILIYDLITTLNFNREGSLLGKTLQKQASPNKSILDFVDKKDYRFITIDDE